MASVLPFNQIKIGSTVVAGPSNFIYGTGKLTLKGDDNAVTTADGKIHNYRVALHPEGNVEVRGDKRSYDTGQTEKWPTLSSSIELGYVAAKGETATVVKTFSGIISVEYDGENNKSTISINGSDS